MRRRRQRLTKYVPKGGGASIKPIPAPKISVVTMDEVPDPPAGARHGRWSELLDQIEKLGKGSALRVETGDLKRGLYIRGQLRAQAKKRSRFMSSSRSGDGTVFYFWLEPAQKA